MSRRRRQSSMPSIPGMPQVDNDDFRRPLLLKNLPGVVAIVDNDDFIAPALNPVFQYEPGNGVIFGDEHAGTLPSVWPRLDWVHCSYLVTAASRGEQQVRTMVSKIVTSLFSDAWRFQITRLCYG